MLRSNYPVIKQLHPIGNETGEYDERVLVSKQDERFYYGIPTRLRENNWYIRHPDFFMYAKFEWEEVQ